MTDPAASGKTGKAWDPIAISAKDSAVEHADLAKRPVGEFDGFSARFRFDAGSRAHAGVSRGKERRWLYVDASAHRACLMKLEGIGLMVGWGKATADQFRLRRKG